MSYVKRMRRLMSDEGIGDPAFIDAEGLDGAINDMQSVDAAYVQLDTEARIWAASLDRERLGSFAVDLDTFVAVHIHRTLLHRYSPSGGAGFLGDIAKFAVDEAMEDALGYFSLEYALRARAEVFYWWSLGFSTKKLRLWAEHVLENDHEYAVYGSRIALMYRHPEYHSFFDAGIWDTALIARCVENAVDPQMAVSLV